MCRLIHQMLREHPLLTFGGGCLLARWLYLQNHRIDVSAYVLTYPHLPAAFDGVTLLHLSDIHNGIFPVKEEERLQRVLSRASVDYILITGDLIDRRKPNAPSALRYAEQWLSAAPVYFVSGNHEARCPEGQRFVKSLQQIGIQVLDLKKTVLKRKGQRVLLAGVPDPYVYGSERAGRAYIQDALSLTTPREDFMLLLAHRPEYLSLYNRMGADLVLSGHAHGGQIRLPGLGGLYAPGQGWLPRYTSGTTTFGDTTMVVSRGLGSSVFPQRLFNRPEVGIIQLVRGRG